MTLPTAYDEYLNYFERALQSACADMNFGSEILSGSMRYSLQAGGKRLRPVLFFAMLDACGCDYEREATFALALEFIHTYSLIHDDLPAMDNDDYRRGRPSNHKVFGEANAILAGDGLLSYAFELAISEGMRGIQYLKAAAVLANAAGVNGMVAGQSYDLFYTGKNCGEAELFTVYRNKTGALIAAGPRMACAIAQKNENIAKEFGDNLGILFQLTDDLLDEYGDSGEVGKTLHKDKEEDKLTAVKVFGAKKAEALADEFAQKCLDSLNGFDGNDKFFRELVSCVRNRKK